MNKLLDVVIQKTNWKKAVLFSLPFVLFQILINISVTNLLNLTDGNSILDLKFGYTYNEALKILNELGANGREYYFTKIVPIDFPFPFSYMLIYFIWIALMLKYLKITNFCKYSLFLPISAMLFDWIENFGIITMLKKYPDLPEWAVCQSSIAGILKTVFTIISMTVMVLLFIIFTIKIIKNKMKKEPYCT